MYKYMILIFVAFQAGCHSAYTQDEASPLYSVPEGSTLILNQTLTIPPGRATVTMQYGRVVSDAEVDIYHANCEFEVRTLSERSRQIEPDIFEIYRVVDQRMTVSLDSIRFADSQVAGGGGGSIGDLDYTTTMHLKSEQQPDVLKMACSHWESPEDDNYLSIEQMRQAMGKIFTLKLAE